MPLTDLLVFGECHFIEQLIRSVRGYFWALEVYQNFHLNYHLFFAIHLHAIKKMPKALMFENL